MSTVAQRAPQNRWAGFAGVKSSIRSAPATVPALGAIALFIVWATSQAGYPVTHWAPGALVMMALLATAVGVVGLVVEEVPVAVAVAVACLAAYCALSFLSILWAAEPGVALEGADRTLLYLIVFALFALWRQRGGSALLILASWTFAMIVLAVYVQVHAAVSSGSTLSSMFPEGRLQYPSGYPNSNAAQWLMAFWPAVLLARSPRLPAAARGLLAGGAVLLADTGLLSLSRGSLYATPVVALMVLAVLPARMRTIGVLCVVAVGVALSAKAILDVGNHLVAGQVTAAAVRGAVRASLAGSVLAAAIVGAAAYAERSAALDSASRNRLAAAARLGVWVLAALTVVAALVLAGNPATRVREGWDSFKGGYAQDSQTGSRLISGLGSERYDFYRVALDEFVAHPLLGTGADNFAQQYLVHGRSTETPRYPHSVEIRVLSETGLVGAVVALVGLAAALLASARALRRADELSRTVAAAALAGFAYWVVHGSLDWFWEFADLGAPAFAMLGLACALAPARAGAASAAGQARRLPGWAVLPIAVIVAASACALAGPWLSGLESDAAVRTWATAPRSAYAELDEAASLDPLSDQPYVLAGSIAVRRRELRRAGADFARALKRTPGDSYALLELGAIASSEGRRPLAEARLLKAAALAPRDELVGRALAAVRAGQTLSLEGIDRTILLEAKRLL